MRKFAALLCISVCAQAEVALAPLFRENGVLQHGKPLPIWGRADAGERVTVELAQQVVTATTGNDGRWLVVLEPLAASSEPHSLVVRGTNTVEVSGLLIGDVWLCSGQSNMEWPVRLAQNSDAEIRAATNPLIRHFKVHKAVAETPVDTAQGEWAVCSPATVGEFSAIAYFFARDLQPRLNIPIGLINCTWGGTPIEAWMSPGALLYRAEFAVVRERWLQTLAEFPQRQQEYHEALAAWEAEEETQRRAGKKSNKPRPFPPPGPGHPATPSGLFNGMIHPIVPAAMRGVLWYQGESNASRVAEYAGLFEELISSWRRHFRQPELPFLWVQLANFRAGDSTGVQWAYLREAQTKALALPHTAQAIAIDIGEANDIHPRNKQEVGRRLALLARAKLFGATVDYSGPVFASVEKENGSLRVRFRHAAGGLIARDKPLQSFQVAGHDRRFYPAFARIEKDTVLVSAKEVADPVAVRYAWSNSPEANLYNGAGLPAAPFRSDDW
jgi:sialate O-acetylesterase